MTKGLRSIRPLSRESLRGIDPSEPGKKLPKFEWVDPSTLFVEDSYQRSTSSRSIKMIRGIVSGWSWARMKPPICVRLPESGNVLVVVDGQHTAIAAASHPGIAKIPVMVVSANDLAGRARSFVGHNRDRVALMPWVIFRAEVAAGDEFALAVDHAVRAAGASIAERAITDDMKLRAGETIAIGTIKALVRKHGAAATTRVLKVLVAAGRAPVRADEIAAAAMIVLQSNEVIDEKLAKVIAAKTAPAWAATARSSNPEDPLPTSLASAWLRNLGVRLSLPKTRPSGNAAKKTIEQFTSAHAAPAAPAAVKPTTLAVPVPPPKSDVPAASQPAQNNVIIRNGIVVDLDAAKVAHRGGVAYLTDDGTALVAALVKVMPSMLPYDNLAAKVFGRDADARLKVSRLVDRVNPLLGKARLEIKTAPKMGNVMADLGPAAT